jgi:hypothetical protein
VIGGQAVGPDDGVCVALFPALTPVAIRFAPLVDGCGASAFLDRARGVRATSPLGLLHLRRAAGAAAAGPAAIKARPGGSFRGPGELQSAPVAHRARWRVGVERLAADAARAGAGGTVQTFCRPSRPSRPVGLFAQVRPWDGIRPVIRPVIRPRADLRRLLAWDGGTDGTDVTRPRVVEVGP